MTPSLHSSGKTPAEPQRGPNRRRFLAVAASTVASPMVFAQAPYPSKPITIVVGFAAGGIADALARTAASLLAEKLKQSVIVDNRAGAGGTIAAGIVAKAPKDGYTLLMASTGHAVTATMMKPLPFDAVNDFASVGGVAASPLVAVVRADAPYKTFGDVVAAAKASPMVYGSGGAGTLTHLLPELVASSTGAQFTHVPYRGTGPAIVDLLGGRVEFVMDLVQTALPHISAGKLRGLVVSSRQRSPQLPDVPTLADTLIPGLDAQGWYGLLAPNGTPAAVLDQLSAALNAALNDPAMAARITNLGSTPIGGTREAFMSLLRSEVKRWGEIVTAKNITS
ncbi:tripartite tricarboxylate transporter substrate binding protein [Hydrogenophaga sp.]|uniref:Bug family tripartite tricarboxylate transporter substrate binding protein n=1 Tax=Hydrogenophaga sp. TaxID=1904254 RepID=UPI0026181FE1|nr:tripartite tricarboxylate transporter substrate binding protein [Hydrogenophaga sp.]MCW5655509.1 tripartite tricarboxylate transporter substrate binding protein [Hydrogenophaga sp.]